MGDKSEPRRQPPWQGTFFDTMLVLRFRIPMAIAFTAATVFLAAQFGNVRLTEDPLGSMYPAGHEFLPALEAIGKMAPEPRMLIAIVEVRDGDIYNRETIGKIDVVTRELMKIDGVLPGEVVSLSRGIADYENTGEGLVMDPILGKRWPETEEDFRRLKRKVAVNPMGPGRYVAYDGTATMITATLVDDAEKARASYEQLPDQEKVHLSLEEHQRRVKEALMQALLDGVERIRSQQQDARHNVYFMGPQLIEAQMTAMGRRHIPIAAAVMFVVIVLSLLVRFRSLRGVLVPVLAMSLSLIWTMGMVGVSGIGFNPMALTFPLILGLFSLVYGVMVVEGYERFRESCGDKAEAIRSAYRHAPVAASILTAGIVLVSLTFTRVPMIRGLAGLGLFWLIGTAAVVFVSLPVLLFFLPVPGSGTPVRARRQGCAAAFASLSSGRGRVLLRVLLVAILLAGGVCAKGLEVGDNVPGSSYIRPGHGWNACFHRMAEKFMGPYQLLVYAKARAEGGMLDPEVVNAIGDFSRYLKHRCGARDSIAFDMMVKAARSMLMDGNPKWQTVPVSREEVKGMGELVVEQGGVESFIDHTFTEATISPFFPEEDTERIDAVASRMQDYIDHHRSDRVDFRLGGGLLAMTKAVNDGTRGAYGRTLAMAFALVLASGMLATGSLLGSLAATLPIAAAQGVVWMIMAAVGMKINMPVTIVSAAAVGFSSIFGFSLIRQSTAVPQGSEGVGADGYADLGRAGGAVLFQGVLVFAAALPWFFTGLRFPSQMVLVSGMTVLVAAVLSVLLFPAFVGLRHADIRRSVAEEEHR
jgi:uncharacterized protein